MNKNLEEYLPDGNKAQYRFMKYRIHKILLVCCSYDGYILEEDGHIESQINQEYLDLNMSNPPSFTRVSSTREALELLGRDDSFDFILTMYNVGELDVFSFAKIVKERHAQIPVALLTSFSKDIYRRLEEQDRSGLDYIFGWHGNTDLIMAIIKLVEDKMNAEEDITDGGVQAILLVEDSIRFYSTYLPELYKLILLQNTEFLKDAFNEQQQILRKRARPKILLATNYEEAVELYDRYKKNILGVISDVGFVLHRNDPPESEKRDAGIDLCRRIKADPATRDIPVVALSANAMPADVERDTVHKLYYGHFFCHVFHQDYIVKKGVDPLAMEHRMWELLDARRAEYPAEHNVGHLYVAKPALAGFYQSLDPTNTFNPGIGHTPRGRNWQECNHASGGWPKGYSENA